MKPYDAYILVACEKQNEHIVEAALFTPLVVKPILDEIRPLIADWQTNGNSRELGGHTDEVWFKAAEQLMARLDLLENTFTIPITDYEFSRLS